MFAYFPVNSNLAHRDKSEQLFYLIVGEGVNKEAYWKFVLENCMGLKRHFLMSKR